MILTQTTDSVTVRFTSSSDTDQGSMFDRYYNFDTIWVLGILDIVIDLVY